MMSQRVLYGLLFLGGFFFAAFAWVLIPTPIVILTEKHLPVRDVVLSLSGALLACTGYFVWIGWIMYAADGRFPLLSYRAFHLVALLNHVGWLFFFPYMRRTNIYEFMDKMFPTFLWIVMNIAISIVALLCVRIDRRAESVV